MKVVFEFRALGNVAYKKLLNQLLLNNKNKAPTISGSLISLNKDIVYYNNYNKQCITKRTISLSGLIQLNGPLELEVY
ncbi:hypothetical protein AGMMS49579_25890 [Spirochaetia bacterium]|nr:hypothetical protein AGMMS49579_25890 [Spirochaetia bacterium]